MATHQINEHVDNIYFYFPEEIVPYNIQHNISLQ